MYSESTPRKVSRSNIFNKCTIPSNFFDELKTGQNEKYYLFQDIEIPEIHVQLFENFQNVIALRVCLAFTKNFEWLVNGTLLGQNNLNSSGSKICKNF